MYVRQQAYAICNLLTAIERLVTCELATLSSGI